MNDLFKQINIIFPTHLWRGIQEGFICAVYQIWGFPDTFWITISCCCSYKQELFVSYITYTYVIYVFKTFLKMSYIFWASISSNVFRKLSFKQMNIFVNIFLKRAGDIWIDDNTFLMRRAWFFLCCSCYCSVPKYITGMVTSASFLF